jgi:DNA-binding XRE family transcriptional regulator
MDNTLKDVRNRAHLNQYGLSVLTGINTTTISLVENGRVKPNAKTRRRLQAVLGSIDWDATYQSNPGNTPDDLICRSITTFVEADDSSDERIRRVSLVRSFIKELEHAAEIYKLDCRRKQGERHEDLEKTIGAEGTAGQ